MSSFVVSNIHFGVWRLENASARSSQFGGKMSSFVID
jgi:hypothetical protein